MTVTTGPKSYRAEQIIAFGLSSLCLVVDAWAVYHTINGAYRITSTPQASTAYVCGLWLAEASLAVAAVYLLHFSFFTRPVDSTLA